MTKKRKGSSLSDMDKQSKFRKFNKKPTKKQIRAFEKTLSKNSKQVKMRKARKKSKPLTSISKSSLLKIEEAQRKKQFLKTRIKPKKKDKLDIDELIRKRKVPKQIIKKIDRKAKPSTLLEIEQAQKIRQFKEKAQEKRLGIRTIGRENIKGKLFVVLRRDGAVVERTKWGSQHLLIDDAFKNLKKGNSIFQDVSRRALVNVFEVKDLRKGTQIPSGKSQFIIQGILPDGTVITARSLQFERSEKTKAQMRQEAFENFLGKLNQHFNPGAGSGEVEDGERIFEKNFDKIQISEGFVRYEAIT